MDLKQEEVTEKQQLWQENNSTRPEVEPIGNCVANTESVFQPQIWCGQHLTGQEVSPTKYVYNYSQIDECHQKTPMCRIAELARYNKIKHEYKLMDESGPAHRKQFTVSLVLTPDQVFYGKGASIKKAQQAAAESALNGTTLSKPPDKALPKKIIKDPQNPIVLLNYVAERLGIEVNFIDEIAPIYPMPPPPPMAHLATAVRPLMRNAFMPPINDRFFVPPRPGSFGRPLAPTTPQRMPVIMRPPNAIIPPRVSFFHRCGAQSQHFHRVRLLLGRDFPEFIGKGMTKKRARNNAASQALSHLGPYLAALEAQSKNGITNGLKNAAEMRGIRTDNLKSVVTTTRNGKPKSSISQIHECALHMRMNVEFLVLKEEGPAHDRHYVLRCKLISAEQVISADGEGSSKKVAKQNACSLMLTKLQSIESSPIFIAATVLRSQKKVGPVKEMKRKTISKDMKMNPEYGHQINPISRLMQVMQARKQNEPKFQLVAERGQSRYKEFVMEVFCDDGLRCEGIGPNKKLAKRAAAEAVLAKIGYVKPMPKPGKSLLKKRPEDQAQQVEIGVFKLDEEGKPEQETTEKNKEGGTENDEKVSEVTLSVTASMGSQVMTFADVDKTLHVDEQKSVWGTTAVETKNISSMEQAENGKEQSDTAQHAAQPKRRVTFSNEVSACPPPDDSSYPCASITALKSEVMVVNKLRKKGRDSKKLLSENEKKEIAEIAREFLAQCDATKKQSKAQEKGELQGYMLVNQMKELSLNVTSSELSSSNGCSGFSTAKHRLESIAEQYKFSVNYSDFPATQNQLENRCFSLISIGIDKPIVCHGSGNTEQAAHEDAAHNALLFFSKI